MNSFFRKKIAIVLLVATIAVTVLMIISTAARDNTDIVTGGTGVVVSASSGIITKTGNGISAFFDNVINADKLSDMLKEAQNKINKLEKETREITSLKNENERLRDLLEFKEQKNNFKSVACEITAKNPGNWYTDFIIDKGINSGITKNCAVITDRGLVGYVNEVGETWAKVVTIIDTSASVGCIVERSGDMAISEGDLQLLEKGSCRISYIAKDAGVVVGDYVETSGIGSIYPKGILIGRITEITPDLQGLYHVATVETAVRFDRLREVLVVID